MFTKYLESRLFDESGGGAGGGAGAGGAAAFDPAAFRSELETSQTTKIMAEVRKDLNGITKKLPGEVAKEIAKANKEASDAAAAAAEAAAAAAGSGGGGGGEGAHKIDPAVNAEINRLSKQLKDITTKHDDAEKRNAELAAASVEKDRVAAIRSGIAELPFKDESARQLFFDAHVGKIKRDEDGNLIGENETGPLPFKDFLKGQAETLYPYLLTPKGGGGGGAGTKVKSGGGFDATQVATALSNGAMNATEFNALTPEQKTAVWNTALAHVKT